MAVQWPILIFSILIGLSGGIMVFLGVGALKNRFKDVRFLLAILAIILLVAGGLASVLHLGHPERALHILGNPASGLSKELFVVGAMFLVALIYAIVAKKGFEGAIKVFALIGLVVGLILPFVAGASYMIAARPAWDSITLPLMYVGTGLGGGMLLAAAITVAKGNAEDSKFAVILALAGVVAMIIAVVAYVLWIGVAPYQAASRSIDNVLSGSQAGLFWGAVVACGLVAPLVCAILALVAVKKNPEGKNASVLLCVGFVCAIVGSVAIRVIMFALGTSVEQFIYL